MSVSIATLNTHWGRDRTGKVFDLAAVLAVLDADVVVLQEIWQPHSDSDGLRALEDQLGYQVLRKPLTGRARLAGYQIVDDAKRAEGTWGMAIAARVPMVHVADWDLNGSRRDPISRKAVVVRLDLGHLAIEMVAVHLSHRLPACITQLADVVQRAHQRGVACIVGDMNCPHAVVSCIAKGFRSAGRGPTWPAHRPLLQLDHVLVDRELSVRGDVFDHAWSDHRAVRATIDLDKRTHSPC